MTPHLKQGDKPTREEMANAVVKKAIKNGYSWMVNFKHLRFNDEDYWRYKNGREIFACLEEVLFEHEFAKKYWGEQNTCVICGETGVESHESHTSDGDDYSANCAHCGADWMSKLEFVEDGNFLPAYLYELQNAVISDDPLLYYYQHL